MQETVDDVLRLLSTGQAKAPSNHVDNRLDVAMHKTQVTRSRSTSSTMLNNALEKLRRLPQAVVPCHGCNTGPRLYQSEFMGPNEGTSTMGRATRMVQDLAPAIPGSYLHSLNLFAPSRSCVLPTT